MYECAWVHDLFFWFLIWPQDYLLISLVLLEQHDLIRYKGFVMPGSSFLLLPCNGGGGCVVWHRLQKQPWATEEGMLSVFLKAVLFVPSPNYGCLASLACCSYHYGSPTSLACCEFGMFMMGAGASLWLLVKLVKYCITLVVITVIATVLHL